MSEQVITGRFKNANFNLYKGKKTNDGSASEWQISMKPSKRDSTVGEVSMWLTLAPQTGTNENGNFTFDWKRRDPDGKGWLPSKAITASLGSNDLGEILTVLNGVKGEVGQPGKGLYHQHPSAKDSSTVIYFSVAKEKEGGAVFGYNLRVSKKSGSDANSVSHFISLAEGEQLRVLLANALVQMFDWDLNKN